MSTTERVAPTAPDTRATSRLGRMFERAHACNGENLARALRDAARQRPGARLCDVGCGDGHATAGYAPAGVAVTGFEFDAEAVALARGRGIDAHVADLTVRWPAEDGAFDLVASNQVIEHVPDVDHFVAEVHRILRPGGVAVVSTENIASWHNVAATVAGWQPFSSANVSRRVASLGNPLGGLRGAPALPEGWQHRVLFSGVGLRDLFTVHGFVDVRILGAGYYPLPAAVGRRDWRHAAFITAVATRP